MARTIRAIRFWMERVMGIEPTSLAWKAAALPLSYTRGEQRYTWLTTAIQGLQFKGVHLMFFG